MLFTRIRFTTEEAASQMFTAYSAALKKKHPDPSRLTNREEFLSFDTSDGGVFLRCVGRECVTLEGGENAQFVEWVKKLGWPQDSREPVPAPRRDAAGAQILKTL
jgi:hypothetical protein